MEKRINQSLDLEITAQYGTVNKIYKTWMDKKLGITYSEEEKKEEKGTFLNNTRVIHSTDLLSSKDDLSILIKELKYNLHNRAKNWIKIFVCSLFRALIGCTKFFNGTNNCT